MKNLKFDIENFIVTKFFLFIGAMPALTTGHEPVALGILVVYLGFGVPTFLKAK